MTESDIHNIVSRHSTHRTLLVPCCLCGVKGTPNHANMCMKCLSQQVNITQHIQNNTHELIFCQECGRSLFHQRWLTLEPESPELLTLCVKKIKGLGKTAKIVDAKFVWTEPHSRRIKIAITVEDEALSNVSIRQATIITFKQIPQMCGLCQKSAMDQAWNHCIQVRQFCNGYKKTFRRLENELIKAGMDKHIVSVEEKAHGFDLWFSSRGDWKIVLDWMKSNHPINAASQPTKHGSTYTHSVQIAPLNKFDLVLVPDGSSRAKMMLLKRITNSLHFLDINTGQMIEVPGSSYWKFQANRSASSGAVSQTKSKKSRSTASSTGGTSSVKSVTNYSTLHESEKLVEFVVIDVLSDDMGKDSLKLRNQASEVVVARESDFGLNDQTFTVKTHLNFLQPGESILGYDLSMLNLTEAQSEVLPDSLVEVVLVHKVKKDAVRKKRQQLPRLGREVASDGIEDSKSMDGYADELVGDWLMEEMDEEDAAVVNGDVPVVLLSGDDGDADGHVRNQQEDL